MDLYILDELFRRTELVDLFESLIWKEAYDAYGDFELLILADRGTRNLFTVGTRLAIKKSKRVMTVETVEDALDSDGRASLKVTGRSLEQILDDRVNRNGFATDMSAPQPWNITGVPAAVARIVFNTLCRNNTIIPRDNIPFLVDDTVYATSMIPEPITTVTFRFDIESVYTTIQNICKTYNMGFRLVKGEDNSELYFDIYTGNNRTSSQTLLPAVIFSPALDNLANTSEIISTAIYKNVAYVFAENGSAIVYAPNVDPLVEGFDL